MKLNIGLTTHAAVIVLILLSASIVLRFIQSFEIRDLRKRLDLCVEFRETEQKSLSTYYVNELDKIKSERDSLLNVRK